MKIKQLDLGFPLNILYKLELGDLYSKNGEIIQELRLKTTLIGKLFEAVFKGNDNV